MKIWLIYCSYVTNEFLYYIWCSKDELIYFRKRETLCFLTLSGSVCVWRRVHAFCVCVFQPTQSLQCGVCLQVVRRDALLALPCQHSFCQGCWEQYCTVLVKDGLGVGEQSVFVCVCVVIKAGIRVGESHFVWRELPSACLCVAVCFSTLGFITVSLWFLWTFILGYALLPEQQALKYGI